MAGREGVVAEGVCIYLWGKWAEVGAWWREPALREQLDTEPEPGVRRYTDASIFRASLFLRFGRLGAQAACCSVCKPNPLKARERGRLIA